MAALAHPPHVVVSGSMRASSELERDEVLALDPALLHGRLDLVPELARRGPAARVVGPGPA